MLLDNFTVIVQLVNFLILIWLLKRFLYGPVMAAIDAREQRLQDQQQRARSEEEAARAKQQQLIGMQDELKRQQDQLFEEARSKAEEERKQLAEQAQRDITALREHWQQRLASEQQEITTRLRKRAEAEMLRTLDTILTDLTTGNLQQATVATFIQRFAGLEDEQISLLRGDHPEQQSAYEIVSATPLTAAEKEQLEHAITRSTGGKLFCYKLKPQLLCGIELHHGGHKLSWSLASHLDKLQRNLAGLDIHAVST